MTASKLSAVLVGAVVAAHAAPGPPVIDPALRPLTVGVMLKFEQKPPSGFVKRLGTAVREIFRPSGLDVRLEVFDNNLRPKEYNRAVVVEMRGACPMVPPDLGPSNQPDRATLGFTRIQEGEVIPFSMVDCEQLVRIVQGVRAQTPNRLFLYTAYWNAMGRVMAHELMHMLLRTADHRETDCLRSPVRAGDLQFSARLNPAEIAALRQIGDPRVSAAASRDKAEAKGNTGPSRRGRGEQFVFSTFVAGDDSGPR